MNEISKSKFENLKNQYIEISGLAYSGNRFKDIRTEQEKNNVYELVAFLISVPQKHNYEFYRFLIERYDLPSVICCILFGKLNKLKGYNLNKKYRILINELKHSPKSLNALRAICDITNIQLIERKNICGNPTVKLIFPHDFREGVLSVFDKLPNRIQVNEKRFDEYDEFVDWWSDVKESDIADNEILFGAYQIMWFYNEVCNGGFGQFWDFAANRKWDLNRMKNVFEKLLPLKYFTLFADALKANISRQCCEKYNDYFDYNEFEKQVLPKIAKIAVDILKNGTI